MSGHRLRLPQALRDNLQHQLPGEKKQTGRRVRLARYIYEYSRGILPGYLPEYYQNSQVWYYQNSQVWYYQNSQVWYYRVTLKISHDNPSDEFPS